MFAHASFVALGGPKLIPQARDNTNVVMTWLRFSVTGREPECVYTS